MVNVYKLLCLCTTTEHAHCNLTTLPFTQLFGQHDCNVTISSDQKKRQSVNGYENGMQEAGRQFMLPSLRVQTIDVGVTA